MAIGILLVVALAVGFVIGQKSPDIPAVDQTGTEVAQEIREVTKFKIVTLAEQNESGELSIATINEEEGKTKLSLHMLGEPDDVNQPVHIHTGACPIPGAIIYPLTNVVDGESETILDISYDNLVAKQSLAINVHKSQAEANVYVSCGNL